MNIPTKPTLSQRLSAGWTVEAVSKTHATLPSDCSGLSR